MVALIIECDVAIEDSQPVPYVLQILAGFASRGIKVWYVSMMPAHMVFQLRKNLADMGFPFSENLRCRADYFHSDESFVYSVVEGVKAQHDCIGYVTLAKRSSPLEQGVMVDHLNHNSLAMWEREVCPALEERLDRIMKSRAVVVS